MQAHPPGWAELVLAFSAKGRYGKWLRQHDVVAKVGDTLFLHGGISPKYATLPVDEINTRVKAGLASTNPETEPLLTEQDGPLWYRGLAQEPEAALASHVDRLLQTHKVRHIVIARVHRPCRQGRAEKSRQQVRARHALQWLEARAHTVAERPAGDGRAAATEGHHRRLRQSRVGLRSCARCPCRRSAGVRFWRRHRRHIASQASPPPCR